jgi:hypothetical protein
MKEPGFKEGYDAMDETKKRGRDLWFTTGRRAELETALALVDEAGEPPALLHHQQAIDRCGFSGASHRAAWVLARRVRELEAQRACWNDKLLRITAVLTAYVEFPHRTATADARDAIGRRAISAIAAILDGAKFSFERRPK